MDLLAGWLAWIVASFEKCWNQATCSYDTALRRSRKQAPGARHAWVWWALAALAVLAAALRFGRPDQIEAAAVVITVVFAARQLWQARRAAQVQAFLALEEQLAQQRPLRSLVYDTCEAYQPVRLAGWQLSEGATGRWLGEAGDVAVRLNVLGKLTRTGHLSAEDVLDMFSGTILSMWYRMAEPIGRERTAREDKHYLNHFEWLAREAHRYRLDFGLDGIIDPVTGTTDFREAKPREEP